MLELYPAEVQQRLNDVSQASSLRHLEVQNEYTLIMRYFPQSYTFMYGVQNNLENKIISITMDWDDEVSNGLINSPELVPGTK